LDYKNKLLNQNNQIEKLTFKLNEKENEINNIDKIKLQLTKENDMLKYNEIKLQNALKISKDEFNDKEIAYLREKNHLKSEHDSKHDELQKLQSDNLILKSKADQLELTKKTLSQHQQDLKSHKETIDQMEDKLNHLSKVELELQQHKNSIKEHRNTIINLQTTLANKLTLEDENAELMEERDRILNVLEQLRTKMQQEMKEAYSDSDDIFDVYNTIDSD